MAMTTNPNSDREVAHGRNADSQLVSDANNNSQHRLLFDLVRAREARGRTVEEVAEILGTTLDTVEDIESGDYEPNLTELRHYAYAIEAVIEFRVHACAVADLSSAKTRFSEWLVSENLWVHTAMPFWEQRAWDTPALSTVLEIVQAEND
ncbi:helix-turn-helix domain-containing protein [Paenarthrobacter ilicis]|uniref:helix-turn-helix domain-containing protein n=1 Tax=Paenarthrobacter ilicis TaxID=43665 RepID=UPI00386A4BD7